MTTMNSCESRAPGEERLAGGQVLHRRNRPASVVLDFRSVSELRASTRRDGSGVAALRRRAATRRWPRTAAQPRDRHRGGGHSTGSFVRSLRGRRSGLPCRTSAPVAPQSEGHRPVGEARTREARARARRTARARGRTRAGGDRRRRRRHPPRRKGSPRHLAQPQWQAVAPATRSRPGEPGTRASDRRSARTQARAARPRADRARPIRRQLIPTRPPFRALRQSCRPLLATVRTTVCRG